MQRRHRDPETLQFASLLSMEKSPEKEKGTDAAADHPASLSDGCGRDNAPRSVSGAIRQVLPLTFT